MALVMSEIKTALISVYDKTWVTTLGRFLADEGVTIYASTGTLKELRKKKIKAIPISELTKSKEILGGRVKTLDFRLYAGILADPSKKRHQQALKALKGRSIGLVAVNFYPFDEKVKSSKINLKEALELIDIGGVSLVRAAAKNFENVVILVSPDDYKTFINEYKENNGTISRETRLKLAYKAFAVCAKYDEAIMNYFAELTTTKPAKPVVPTMPRTSEPTMSQTIDFKLKLKQHLRYGENPHQMGSLYEPSIGQALKFKLLQGRELSYNNIRDAGAAFRIASFPYELPYFACIIKHLTPCGAAQAESPLQAFVRAREADPVSAFGGIIGTNFPIDEELAREITKSFFEILVAPSVTLGALREFSKKKKMRIIEVSEEAFTTDRERIILINEGKNPPILTFVRTPFGYLVQNEDVYLPKPEELQVVSDTPLRAKYKSDLQFGVRLIRFIRSNSVIVIKDGAIVGVGAGQTNRVDATRLALEKAKKKCEDAVLVSDGFFPFADSVELAASAKIAVLAAPSGSIRDHEIIQRANELRVCLVFMPTRHFYH